MHSPAAISEIHCANAEWLKKIAIDGNLLKKGLEAQERQLGSH